ncbi:MAG TPA: hypothetical protein VF592_11395 [Sphingomonas sp.]|jgi:hypothetical protein|uniref:hypothetical protein n=1 Tax=Sphingomonas sp. TaxID=28214 RepID=UPI002ED8153E
MTSPAIVLLEIGREALAYGIMGAVAAIGVPALLIRARRHRLRKLRRRGIKRYDR